MDAANDGGIHVLHFAARPKQRATLQDITVPEQA
jgi:hypothetical protein